MREWVRRDDRVRWFAVATVFTTFGLGLLKLFVDVLHWPYAIATLVQSETCNLLRFFVNDRWVFGKRRPTWKRLVQYHVANAMGFAVWWAGANGLKALGVNYLLASVIAMAGSFGVSWLTNFKWIWRKKKSAGASADEAEVRAQTR
jgi:Predicted membrane protein